MTRKNDDLPDDLMPTPTNLVERTVLFVASAIASAGLLGYTIARFPVVADIAPNIAALPHLLGGSVFVFAVGAGAFAMTFNVFTKSATINQVTKVVSVYMPIVGLLTVLVDRGVFHPRLAMVFVCLLCSGGLLFGMYHKETYGSFRSYSI